MNEDVTVASIAKVREDQSLMEEIDHVQEEEEEGNDDGS